MLRPPVDSGQAASCEYAIARAGARRHCYRLRFVGRKGATNHVSLVGYSDRTSTRGGHGQACRRDRRAYGAKRPSRCCMTSAPTRCCTSSTRFRNSTPRAHERQFAGRYYFHEALSLDVLPSLEPMDAALIDGDHNWYTVYHELKLLAEGARRAGAPLPVLVTPRRVVAVRPAGSLLLARADSRGVPPAVRATGHASGQPQARAPWWVEPHDVQRRGGGRSA